MIEPVEDHPLRTYLCSVTLRLQDVTLETAQKFFADGAEVEGCEPVDGYIATIENPHTIKCDD